MYRIVFLLSLSLLINSCGDKKTALPYYNTPDFTPHFLQNEVDIDSQITHRISDFALVDQNNKLITQKDIEGKIHLACFFFTSCGSICPKIIASMKRADSAFKGNKRVKLLSYSVTPWIDSVGRLKHYARTHRIDNPNWHLLTGSKSEIYKLARQSYFAEEDLGFSKDSSDFLHSEHILLVDKNKRIRAVYNGTLELEAEQMVKDVSELLKE